MTECRKSWQAGADGVALPLVSQFPSQPPLLVWPLGGLHPPIIQGQNQDPEEAGTCSGPSRSPSAVPYLDALVEEGVPDLEEDVADETVCKDHKEPVEGDEGQVYVALPQVGHQPGQLLQEEVL